MGLFNLLGIKPSAEIVADKIVDELRKIVPFYSSQSCLVGKEPIYSQGGCECGCAPEFQFFYDGKNIAIFPCFLSQDFIEPIEQNRKEFVSSIQKRLAIPRVDLIMRGEQPPEYCKNIFS